jgi:hypothetical protein
MATEETQRAPEREADDKHTAADELRETAERDGKRLQEGPALEMFGGRLPYRTLASMALFVVVFLLVWVGLWAALGGLGLGLGWIVAALAGLLAVKLLAARY